MKTRVLDNKQEEKQDETDNYYFALEEPKNFHIITDPEGLILNTEEDAKALLSELENAKYNKKLAKFVFSFKRDEIKDIINEKTK